MGHLSWLGVGAVLRELGGQPLFRRLLLAQCVSELGNWLTNVALVLLVFRLSGHPGAAAFVLMAKLIPRVLFYPIGGVLADRFDRRQLMIGSDLIRAGLALSLLLVQTAEGLWWALLATALSQAMASIANPAMRAVVPATVPSAQLGRANAVLGAVGEISFFVGPLLGAALLTLGPIELTFVLDALTFVLSAALLAGLTGLSRPPAVRQPLSLRHDLVLGWATVRADAGLRLIFGAQTAMFILTASLNVLLVPLLVGQWSAAESQLGLLYGAIGGGGLVGTLLAMRLPEAWYRRACLGAVGLSGLIALLLSQTIWFWPAVGLLLVMGGVNMVAEVVATTYLQQQVPDDRLGRVFGLLFCTSSLGLVLGSLLGLTASVIPPTALVAGLGSLVVLTGLWLGWREGRLPASTAADGWAAVQSRRFG